VRGNGVAAFAHDLRQALRSLRRAPALVLAAIATVAAGLAAATTVFAFVDALFFRPLSGIVEQSRLINVHATAPDGSSFHAVSTPTWRDLGDGGGSFEGLAAFSSRLASLTDGRNEPRLAVMQLVSGNYFEVLGARPALGKFFGPAEDAVPGRDAVAVLGFGAWKSRFGSDPAIVGREIAINGRPFTVVGVAPSGFSGTFLALPFDVWIPLAMAPVLSGGASLEDRGRRWLEMVGRRKSGITLEQARERMKVVAARQALAYPDTQRGVGYDLRPVTGFEDSLRDRALPFFAVLAGMAGLVLAVAGVNASGLLLARALAREKEFAVRQALGAGRARLSRLLLIETLLLFAAGGAAGAAFAGLAAPLLESFRLPLPIPLAFDFSPGLRVTSLALGSAVAAGLLFGAITAAAATRSGLGALRSGASTERPAAARLRSSLVATQVAGSVLLLIVAGLFVRTVRRAAAVDPGFDPRGLSLYSFDLSMLGYDAGRAAAFRDALVERAAGLPGVTSAAITGEAPLGPGHRSETVGLPGAAPEERVAVDLADVSESYFATMRVPIRNGRGFATGDGPGAEPVAVVNETLARRLWPGRDALGRTVVLDRRALRIVGVAGDGKYRTLWEAPRGFIYLPARQAGRLEHTLLIRSNGAREALSAALAREIRRLEPALPRSALVAAREHMGFSLLPQRVGAAIGAVLGALGLGLASIGLTGLVAYSVGRRTREIGVRMSLGARPADVVRLEIRRGIRVAAAGLAAGTAAALLATRLLSGLLFGIGAIDPVTFAAVLFFLGAMALAATYLPARRAARVDPIRALRAE
jgi:predicted permease